MKKNILAEYQKRVEQWVNDSEQKPIELQERIASQERELQERVARQQSELQAKVTRQQSELQSRIELEQNGLTQTISEKEAELMELQGPVVNLRNDCGYERT